MREKSQEAKEGRFQAGKGVSTRVQVWLGVRTD